MLSTDTQSHAAFQHIVEALNELAVTMGEDKLVPIHELHKKLDLMPVQEKPGYDFDFPETGWRKSPHPGTMRAHVLDMLLKGATFEEVQEAVGKLTDTTKRTLRTRTFRVIRDMHYRLGYRMTGKPGDRNTITAYPLGQNEDNRTSIG